MKFVVLKIIEKIEMRKNKSNANVKNLRFLKEIFPSHNNLYFVIVLLSGYCLTRFYRKNFKKLDLGFFTHNSWT